MAVIAPSAWTTSTPLDTLISSPIGPLQIDNARKPYSFSSPDDNLMRLEVRKGDVMVSPHWTDPPTSERNALQEPHSDRHPVSEEMKLNFDIMIEPGATNTARWVQLGGVKGAFGNSYGEAMELGLQGDKFTISANYESSPGVFHYRTIWTSPTNLERGKWYDIKVDFDWGPSGDGKLDVLIDDQKVVDYDGRVGYYSQTDWLWKTGIYRNTAPETLAIQLKDLSMETGSDLPDFQSGGTGPPPTPEPTPAVTLAGTDGDDKLNGSYSSPKPDVIDGKAGNDVISGFGESDTLTGGAGKDVLVFNTPLGPSNIDTITDFNPADDTIHLNDIVFANVGWGPLASRYFWSGTAAHDGDDRIIYDIGTGALYYDKDGTGAAEQVQFAQIANKAALTAADFSVI